MKLGQKVECNGYLKKIKGLDYIYATKKHFEKENIKANGMLEEPKFYLDDECEYKQKTMEIKYKHFKGIAVAHIYVSTENLYTLAEREIFDPITYGFVDYEIKDECKVEKINYIECYRVYYSMGKSRLVPINLVEEILC